LWAAVFAHPVGEEVLMKRLLYILAFVITALAVVPITVGAQSNGKIKGKLTYPSEFIPADMVVCVEGTSRTICSNSRDKSGYIFKVNRGAAKYEVSLPAGKYYIYAKTREMAGEKAYYNEFVKCGMDVRCKSKKKIRLNVRSGGTISGITVGDWYP
jgi:hypothetical protein